MRKVIIILYLCTIKDFTRRIRPIYKDLRLKAADGRTDCVEDVPGFAGE